MTTGPGFSLSKASVIEMDGFPRSCVDDQHSRVTRALVVGPQGRPAVPEDQRPAP